MGWPIDPAGPPPTIMLDELLRFHEYERERIGQELHDSAGQLLVAFQLSVAHFGRSRRTPHDSTDRRNPGHGGADRPGDQVARFPALSGRIGDRGFAAVQSLASASEANRHSHDLPMHRRSQQSMNPFQWRCCAWPRGVGEHPSSCARLARSDPRAARTVSIDSIR